jgi:hypothetical protein
MKTVMITRSDEGIKGMTDVTHPLLKSYARKFGMDFINLSDEPKLYTEDNRPHYRILEVKSILEDYDRALLIDSDTVITPNCPNIFDEVPVDCIGSVFEDKGSRLGARRSFISEVQRAWGDIGWTSGYTNAGVFVLSKEHSNIFDSVDGNYWLGNGSADVHMAYQANKLGHKIHELSYRWNHMTMFSEPWNGNPSRFDSHIIHYAGRGIFDGNNSDRLQQIKEDVRQLYDV